MLILQNCGDSQFAVGARLGWQRRLRTSRKRRTGFWPRILHSLQSSKTDKLTDTHGLNVPKLGETGPEVSAKDYRRRVS